MLQFSMLATTPWELLQESTVSIYRFFSLGEATSLGEGKPVKPRLKIDIVSYPTRAGGGRVGKYGIINILIVISLEE